MRRAASSSRCSAARRRRGRLAARAQQAGMVRWIGVLMISPDSDLLGRERAAVLRGESLQN